MKLLFPVVTKSSSCLSYVCYSEVHVVERLKEGFVSLSLSFACHHEGLSASCFKYPSAAEAAGSRSVKSGAAQVMKRRN